MNSIVDAIVEQFGHDAETFDIEFPNGSVVGFKAIASYGAFKAFERSRSGWIEQMLKIPESALPPAWQPFAPLDRDTLSVVFNLHHTMVEPKPMTEPDLLKLCAKCGAIVDGIHELWSSRQALGRALGYQQKVDEAGNASEGTARSETVS